MSFPDAIERILLYVIQVFLESTFFSKVGLKWMLVSASMNAKSFVE
jgi:hypothetical protein